MGAEFGRIIGAAVWSNHQVELLDMELDTDLAGTLQRFRPDLVGASAPDRADLQRQTCFAHSETVQLQIYAVLGGHHASLCPEEFNTPYIDAIVLGEGVPAFREIVQSAPARLIV